MMPILYLANAGSPHVRQWAVFMRRLGLPYAVATIHAGNLLAADVPVRRQFRWLRHLGRAGDVAGYVLLGLWLRLCYLGRRDAVLLHAHNTSGYGLAAWLSGCPYVITTYGTEVFTAPVRGGLYRWLILSILGGARAITASTPDMAAFLQQHFRVEAARLHAFTLGIDPVFHPDADARAAGRAALGTGDAEPVWFYNRRLTPLYNTLEVVAAFRDHLVQAGLGRLVLMEGDCDPGYRDAVRAAIADCPAITLLQGFMDQTALRGWLCAADFCLSVPGTDQLSSSILEGIACGCLPVLLDNPAYAPVTRSPLATVVPEVSVAALRAAFAASAARGDWRDEDARKRRLGEILGDEFTVAVVCGHVRALYARAGLQA